MDIDAASGLVNSRLQVNAGTLGVTLSGVTTISAGSNGSGDLTLRGTVADINATLASLTYTGAANANGPAAATLTLTTNDGGNTGTGGALQDVDAATISITPVNDAPTGSVTIDNTTPTQGQTLTASNTLTDADGLGPISYQWQRDGVDIGGATGVAFHQRCGIRCGGCRHGFVSSVIRPAQAGRAWRAIHKLWQA